jgi:hypothetical protein
MGNTGKTTIDFTAFPGKPDVTKVITGETGIASTSKVEAWVIPEATADHSIDEHWVEEIDVSAGNIVAGTGFTIYGVNRHNEGSRPGGRGYNMYGLFTIGWAWL